MINFDTEFKGKLLNFPTCKEPVWCRGGHAQTLFGHFFKKESKLSSFRRIRISTYDDNSLFCYLHEGTNEKVIVLFHGLTGSSYSGYMTRLGNRFAKQGNTVLLVNHRGAHPFLKESESLYHSGRSEDASAVFEWLRESFPKKLIVAIGFSMSANILLLNAAGIRSKEKPDFLIAVNGPIDLLKTVRNIDNGINRFYGHSFLREMMKMHLTDNIPHTIFEYDQRYTAPRGGFASAHDYYRQCSALNYVKEISIPTLILAAKNDPIISSEMYFVTKWPESVCIRMEESGGHLGYIQKLSQSSFFWMDEYFDYAIQLLPSKKVVTD
jgi:predicted alpha/beta-fold hydrolase